MVIKYVSLPPVIQALLAGIFTWFITALGVIFLKRDINRRILGASLVLLSIELLPYALSFAAGAMIYVVIEELIPESQAGENADLSTLFAILGFVIMMILDISLG